MQTEFQNHIQTLRNTGSFKDWESARNALSKLSTGIDATVVSQIVRLLSKRFLQENLKYATDESTLQQLANQFNNVQDLNELRESAREIREKLKSRARKPGINNFRSAMRDVDQLLKFDASSQEDIELFVDAVSGIIMATLDCQWGGQNPTLWLRAFEHKNKEDFLIRANHFATDSVVSELNSELWGLVADTFQQSIGNG